MSAGTDWCRWVSARELILQLRVQPRASRDEIVGPHGDALKVRITAPPVEGQANEHLLRFLAKAFGVPRGQVSLLQGATGRVKRVTVFSPRQLPGGIPPYTEGRQDGTPAPRG